MQEKEEEPWQQHSVATRVAVDQDTWGDFDESHRFVDQEDESEDVFAGTRASRIADRESEYQSRRFNVALGVVGEEGDGGYRERMRLQMLEKEELKMRKAIERASENGEGEEKGPTRRKRRWGSPLDEDKDGEEKSAKTWDDIEEEENVMGRKKSRWSSMDGADATPNILGPKPISKWDMATPTPNLRQSGSKWDQTPVFSSSGMQTPLMTPGASSLMQTPMTPSQLAQMTPDQISHLRKRQDLDVRNRYMTDEELDALLPSEGYELILPPSSYQPSLTSAAVTRKNLALITPQTPVSGFSILPEVPIDSYGVPITSSEDPSLPMLKPEDLQYFSQLVDVKDEEVIDKEKQIERRIMKLLLQIKNGTPPIRKSALRQLTEKARDFGAGPIFNCILPLLMSPTLEDQERHLLVKVIDRVLLKLDDLVRPYVHKILVVIEPLLIDQDYYARVEGREIISNLAKAAGLATMIATMRPDIDNVDEYVRNTTARAFAVVATALGIPSLLPFLKAVCQSKKSWEARHTGIKIIQQIALTMGCAVLPQLTNLVSIIKHGLADEHIKVKTMTALALSALAEASAPYGIESFHDVLKPLSTGIVEHRGKTLAAFFKAIGFIIPLMEPEHTHFYTKYVMERLIREFTSPDDGMKKIVLGVLKQCVISEGVDFTFIKVQILPEFLRCFWIRRMALDKRNQTSLVDTTVAIAMRVGVSELVGKIVPGLKDESEPFRKMTMETIDKVLKEMGAADIDERLEELLIDGALFAFQEQISDDSPIILSGFGTILDSLGIRAKPYLNQIIGIIKWRLNNRSAKVRQQACDLITKVAVPMKNCDEELLMGHLGVVLYEQLGEEYPDVLGSILGALKAIVNVIGMSNMTPSIKDLLPRLTPILKNRHEKVQENCIDLVGRIADRGAEFVSPREWMRICFELLEMLKAPRKSIRRATVNTFGYIARAIGPQDVLSTLLNNLRVQERQNRVCTTVAIAIVAETCSPFTVLPALLNEYRVPELNVQNGVLKSLSFMFEYIGEMGKDYIYAAIPLLEDALMDRDMVHRQTACATIKRTYYFITVFLFIFNLNTLLDMALGVAGLGSEDGIEHLLNFVWPNIFETSAHVINAVMEAIEGIRVACGPTIILQYCLQGLFHPARKVRNQCWKVYNSTYIACQDALVPAYPRIPDTENNIYERYELGYFL